MPTVDQVIATVASRFNRSPRHLVSPSKARQDSFPRFIAMWIVYQWKSGSPTRWGCPTVGKHFGNRDGEGVRRGVKIIDALVKTDVIFAAEIAQLEQQIGI